MAPAAALAEATDHERQQQEIYAHCMTLLETNPDTAYDLSQTWLKTGGGLPAQHCAAMALVRLKRYDEAGTVFEAMVIKAPTEHPELAVNIYAQAGNTWLLANLPLRAHELFSAALKLLPADSPERVELLVDRARALTLAEDNASALADLNAALVLSPNRADILTLKASSHRKLNQLDEAQAAVTRALTLSPEQPEALLERGNLRLLRGDDAGAREDWLRFLVRAGDSPEAEAVRRNLERLDVKIDTPPSRPN